MTPDELKEIGRRVYLEAIEKGDVSVVDEFVAHDCIDISPGLPPGMSRDGGEPLKAFVEMLHHGFSDISVRIHQLLVEGDDAVGRFTIEATHTGDFLGIPPTGKTVTWDNIDIVQVRGGKIRQHYGLYDQFGLLTQLGVIPEMAGA